MQYFQDYVEFSVRAFSNQTFSPERFGPGWLAEYDADLIGYVKRLKVLAVEPDQIARFVEGYKQRVSKWLGAETRCASSMIVGPARFPVARQQKYKDWARNHMEAIGQYAARVLSSYERRAKWAARQASTVTPLMEAQRKLNLRQKEQDRMKAANAAIRSAKDPAEREVKLLDLGYSPADAANILKPNCFGQIGYADYTLRNNNAEIRRLKERLVILKQKEDKAAAAAQTGGPKQVPFSGGVVELDYSDDRLRIRHDSKPDSKVISELKRRAFKWSPRNSSWQRQITINARWAASELTGIPYAQLS